jgi:hypothetical protein
MSLMPNRQQVGRFIEFVFLQGIAKALGVIQGLLVIHLISKWDYGIYALLFAVVIATANIAVCGVGMFVSSVGGKHVNDPLRMSSIYAAGKKVQNRLVAAGFIILAVLLPWQCQTMEVGNPLIIACLTALGLIMLVLHAHGTLCREMLMIALRLRDLQVLELIAICVRLALIGFFYAVDLLNVVTFFSINLAISAWSIAILDRWVHRFVLQKNRAEMLPDDWSEAKRTVIPQLPNAAYSSVQDQVPFLLMSWLGSVQNIAEYAAIGRLGVIFSFFFDVLGGFFMPRIGRCQDPKRLTQMIVALLSSYYVIVLCALITAYFLSGELVWLLGKQYANVEADIPVMLALIGVGAVSGSLFLINSARAWLRHSWLFIVSTICSQAAFILVLDLHTLRGMLTFAIVPHIPFIGINLFFLVLGLKRIRQ